MPRYVKPGRSVTITCAAGAVLGVFRAEGKPDRAERRDTDDPERLAEQMGRVLLRDGYQLEGGG